MSCDAFLEKVDAFLGGSLARTEREELERHLGACADCRGLVAALSAVREGAEDTGLSESILARTSGATCESARSRLCAWVDLELGALDADLVSGHLRHCAECDGLARALASLPGELARFAVVDPGDAFVEEILARTSRRLRREPMAVRFARLFGQMLDRPRIALEGAFVATAILVVPLLAPGSPFAHLPTRALDIVRESAPGQRLLFGQLRGTMSDLEASLVVGAKSVWEVSRTIVVEDATAAAAEASRNFTSTWGAIRRSFGTFSDPAASGQKGAGSGEYEQIPESAQENKP